LALVWFGRCPFIRQQRKEEHLNISARLDDGPGLSGFNDVYFIHDTLASLDLAEIDLSTSFLKKRLACPLVIEAISGGTAQAGALNRNLAQIACKYGLAMAVGSQTIALENPEWTKTFTIAREINPDGVVLANVSAWSSSDRVREAVRMIAADGVQLHFNIAQELAMREGERNFSGTLDNLKRIVDKCQVPVIAKEVGFGFSREAAEQLYKAGVRIIDIGGKGGTNFIAIEKQRRGLLPESFYNWGIPTAVSLAEVLSLDLPLEIIASGGIRSALDIAKAISMGAELAGMAGWFLKILSHSGYEKLEIEMENLIYQLKAIMLMCGAGNIERLQKKPLIILNQTAEWLRLRNIDPAKWSNR